MMIASPTAASAAATVMTKNTNTCPATPYDCANATKVRFTALSISSTHMNTMIALRRINTPNTPIVNNTAEKKSASASISFLRFSALLAEHHRANDRGEEQNTRHLEGQQIFVEQRAGDRRNRARLVDLLRGEARGQRQIDRRPRPRQREDLGEQRQPHRAGAELPSQAAHVGRVAAPEVEQHDHEQKHDHDRAGVYQDLNGADELRA